MVTSVMAVKVTAAPMVIKTAWPTSSAA